jgi:hypothetical protein
MARPLYEIAKEIKQDWKNIPAYAEAYRGPMSELTSVDEQYYCDSAESIVLYFLSNAQTWRGEVAKRIKKELKDMVGIK